MKETAKVAGGDEDELSAVLVFLRRNNAIDDEQRATLDRCSDSKQVETIDNVNVVISLKRNTKHFKNISIFVNKELNYP